MQNSGQEPFKIHPLADVQTETIGAGTTVWQFAVVLKGAKIGSDCNINCHTFIENDVILGDRVTVKSGVYLWDGLRIEDDVFIGPAAVFTNDLTPRSKIYRSFEQTQVKRGASIGANATILGGVTIGQYAMVGMGANVTKDVPDYALVYGNPATVRGWVDETGAKLSQVNSNTWENTKGQRYESGNFGLKPKRQ